jgi:hypothetical protein
MKHIELFEDFLNENLISESFDYARMKEGQKIQYWEQSAKDYIEGVVTSIDKKNSKVTVDYKKEVPFGEIDNWYDNPWKPKKSELEANLRSIAHLKESNFEPDEVLEAKEESKKEDKKEEKKEEPKEEEIDSKLTPSSSIEFVKGYMKDQKMKMKDGEKSKFQELIEVLKDFVKERKELGRKH